MKIGDELTIAHDIIGESGQLIFTQGQKVIVREIWKDNEHWSNVFNITIPEKIHGVKLVNHYGIMFLNSFEETQNLK